MNLARVLDQSLPDIPALRKEETFPCIHPRLVVREHEDRDGTVIMCVIPGGRPPCYFRFTRYQYLLASLFDGRRSYADVAEEYNRQTGANLTGEQVKGFADGMEKVEFWYHTPLERSEMLCHELMTTRHQHLKKKRDWGDLSSITFVEFDPDRYITWVYRHFSWVYSRAFLVWSAFMFLVMCFILGTQWHEVWNDSLAFYDLLGKGGSHAVLFFGMFLSLGAVHETAHGLTCKHFGGSPHRMGAFTIYLVPAIFCDVSEVWVFGGRWERLATVVAGVLSEVVVASYATVVWWATPRGTLLHTASYYIILSGGIFCVLVNWNPLSKMDGYYLFSEFFRFHDIKGQSNALISAWVRKNIFRMPVTVPIFPYPKNIVYPIYGVLSGCYCYFMLTFFSRVAYHMFSYYTPRWAIVPAGIVALIIFSTRIRMLVAFMRDFYHHKMPIFRAHWRKHTLVAAGILIALLVPVRREYVEEPFVLEPLQRAVLRAEIGAHVDRVLAIEGDHVVAGQPLIVMHDLEVQTRVARASTDLESALGRSIEAELRYGDFASARQGQLEFAEIRDIVNDRARRLQITSPISGVVVTPRTPDLVGTYAKAGTQLLEVADVSVLRARLYVPEPEMRKLTTIHEVVLHPDSHWGSVKAKVAMISPASEEHPAQASSDDNYKGASEASEFDVQVLVTNRDEGLTDGMTGTAKIFGRRRGILPTLLQPVRDGLARRIW